jgi:hypothetical protein
MTVEAIRRATSPWSRPSSPGATLYILFSIVTDVCYALVDPRVRLR